MNGKVDDSEDIQCVLFARGMCKVILLSGQTPSYVCGEQRLGLPRVELDELSTSFTYQSHSPLDR